MSRLRIEIRNFTDEGEARSGIIEELKAEGSDVYVCSNDEMLFAIKYVVRRLEYLKGLVRATEDE